MKAIRDQLRQYNGFLLRGQRLMLIKDYKMDSKRAYNILIGRSTPMPSEADFVNAVISKAIENKKHFAV